MSSSRQPSSVGKEEVAEDDAFEVMYRLAEAEDVPVLAAMEARCYPSDEAASEDSIAFRQAKAGDYFMVMLRRSDSKPDGEKESGEEEGEIIGFINSTLTTEDHLTQESMSRHESGGNHLCIHSVVVDLPYRRRGLGQAMLREYMRRLTADNPEVKMVSLIAKEHLVGFYCDAGVGFRNLGKSLVQHGKDQWYECSVTL